MATTDLERELERACDIARAAGKRILELRGAELGVEMKVGDEPVTIADREANALILEQLAQAFPADPVVSEEAPPPEGGLGADRVWYVDPIDGTKDFIRGSDGFSVMIGLALANRPALGVVYQPALDRMFTATPDGAWVDGKPLHVSDVKTAGEARLVASASHRSADIDRVKESLGIDNEVNVGSVGVKLCLIALGQRDIYVNPQAKTKVWDTCAPEAILTRAGGRLSDLFGDPVSYSELRQRRGLVATNGHIHDEVIAKMAPLFEAMRRK